MKPEFEVLDAILRKDLYALIRKSFEELNPGTTLHDNWHLEALAYHLMQFAEKEIKRLIITMPPRSLKSHCASVALPAWLLGRNPAARIVCASYSDILAGKFARDTERVMKSHWYRRAFPGTEVQRWADRQIETKGRGFRFTTSVGGSLRGLGGGWIIIDDPVKGDGMMSGVELENVIEWYRGTVYTRLDAKKEDGICVVMQRVHVDDLAGYLLEQDGWTVLNLPAIAPELVQIPIADGVAYEREMGELLHPEREDLEVLKEAKEQLGSVRFEAQYQQNPVLPGGNLIQRDWFKTYEHHPRDWFDLIVQSWDTASAAGPENSYSVCLTFGIKENRYYLLHVLRERMNFPDLKATADRHARRWGADSVLIEKAASGFQLLDELHQTTRLPLIAIAPDADKILRVERVSTDIEAGRVFLPKEAPWLAEFLREVLAFPQGKYSDQVDALAHFLYWAKNRRHPPKLDVKIYGFGGSSIRDRYYERNGRSVFD